MDEEGRAEFDAVVARTTEFRAFRSETARLGRDESPALANVQGNNQDNRANRQAYQAEIDAVVVRDQNLLAELKASVAAFQTNMLTMIAMTVLIGLGSGIAITSYIGTQLLAGPISGLTGTMQSLAEGDLDVDVPYLEKRDEIGAMARTLQVFKDNARTVAALNDEEKSRALATAARAAMMEQFQSEFGEAVTAAIGGDFGTRINQDLADPDIARIAATSTP